MNIIKINWSFEEIKKSNKCILGIKVHSKLHKMLTLQKKKKLDFKAFLNDFF